MTNYQSMAASFEREKNIKASAYTGTICIMLFLLFFLLQWTLPQIPAPVFGEGIEVNLGNSETGLGNVAPQVPGDPSLREDTRTAPPKTTQEATQQPKINTDEYVDGDAPAVNKEKAKLVAKPVINPSLAVKKTMPAAALVRHQYHANPKTGRMEAVRL